MILKKKIIFFYLEVNSQEAKFWERIINNYSHSLKNEEKFKRLSKIVCEYKSLCDVCGRLSRILIDLERIKSDKKPL